MTLLSPTEVAARSRWWKVALLVVGAVVVLYPLVYFGMLAGDAEIHLVYGESAADGRFFEFNPDEKSSGVTSVGYMFLVGGLFKVLPALHVPLALKAINLAGWYALVLVIFLLARRLLNDDWWALGVAAVAGLLPGSAYNSTIGMENGLFALFVFLAIYLIARWHWLDPKVSPQRRQEVWIGLALAAAASLRPEGFLVVPIVFGYRAAFLRTALLRPSILVTRFLIPGLPFAVVLGSLALFHLSQTGDLLPSSGASRMAISAREAIFVGPLWFTTKFGERLVYYPALTILWAVGNWVVLSGNAGTSARVTGLLMVQFWTFFLLYSTVLGSAHLARYVIFLMPMLALTAGVGGIWLWSNWRRVTKLPTSARWASVGLAALSLAVVFGIETDIRRGLGAHNELTRAMHAPEERSDFSDAMLASLGSPSKRPVSLAYQEVQLRYWLDDRFVVRSLDGRVDHQMIDFINDGNFDHISYLQARNVDFVMDLVNYNRDRTLWSLGRLLRLEPGQSETASGLSFTKLDNGAVAVDHTP